MQHIEKILTQLRTRLARQLANIELTQEHIKALEAIENDPSQLLLGGADAAKSTAKK